MQPVSDPDPYTAPVTPPDGLGPGHPDGALHAAPADTSDLSRANRATRPDATDPTRQSTSPAPRSESDNASPGASAAPAANDDERLAFLSFAAHELRGPLTAVKGYAQLVLIAARKDPTFPARSRRALHAIDQQTTRMADMVAELLDATRIQRGAFELNVQLIELNLLVQHAVEQRRASLEQHTIALEAGRETLIGMWDAARVEQIVRDLLDNAVRYSPNGGVITVSMARADTMARVCVRDPGIGVPESERERIFEAFYRGDIPQQRHLSGLGLGLYVGRTVAERQGGRLWLDTLPPGESGSRFCVELPLAHQ